ncbi:phage tail tape measure protein, partial [Klebsiella pneumoniae]|uniref:phage tail tape measure protein n=1 Tax=Klebsiella pneumoniae TaxID=573 RepID=UPI001D12D57E
MILLRLVKPPKQAQHAMEQLGISVADAAGNILPLGEIIGQLERAFANLTEAQQVQAAGMIAGVESTSGLLTLINNGQASFDSFTGSLENAGGTAKEIADIQLDTLNGAIVAMTSALEGVGTT